MALEPLEVRIYEMNLTELNALYPRSLNRAESKAVCDTAWRYADRTRDAVFPEGHELAKEILFKHYALAHF